MTEKRSLSTNQDLAANPTENVWVQANAGTGKTSVLVQRLLRILFRTKKLSDCGILCLTYTNAGAGEMRNRILAALRKWAVASDEKLKELLTGISENAVPNEEDLNRARKIFFEYIDNQEILKIKTIHGFCEEILRKFPLEAGISPAWSLVSDANQRVLLQETFESLINSSNEANVNNAFAHIVSRVSETYMDDLLEILSSQYKHFFQVKNYVKYREYFIDTIRKFLNLDDIVFEEDNAEKLKKIIEITSEDINSSKKPAGYLIKIINNTRLYIDKAIDFEEYKKAYLKADGGKIQNVSKKDYLSEEQERVYQKNQFNASQLVFEDTLSLFDLSAAFTKKYKEIKSKKNLLDFEDLILHTKQLFSSQDSMGWVLSQLNVKLSHILVDEAQDTSPIQWDILQMLSGDFFTDGDTTDLPHSLFVVGDTKQSIYGFQGADPNAFATSREEISNHIKQNLRTINEVPLTQSFRSLSAILNTVDTFFDNNEIIALTNFKNNKHIAFRKEDNGLVEIHKLISKQDDEKTVENYVSIIADKIKDILETTKYKPSDIMVLVQNRKPMASPLVKKLKKLDINVAGSDRIILPDYPAIRDLLNIIRFCLTPDDDYSLCCILKSPAFRLKEQDIFNICQIRNNAKKQQNLSENPTVFNALASYDTDIQSILKTWIEKSKTLAPYSFFSLLLNDFNLRKKMIAALGTQIIDPLEEFMTICLSYERTQTGTLKQFLKWFITGGSEIKRDMNASDGVRIVTVHGSKGLEAPIVFLIDTVRTPKSEKILPLQQSDKVDIPAPWLWAPKTDESERRTYAAEQLMKTRIAEYYRLLYVAMTRARDRLYIYGYTPNKNAPETSWHYQLWNVFSENQPIDKDVIRIPNGK